MLYVGLAAAATFNLVCTGTVEKTNYNGSTTQPYSTTYRVAAIAAIMLVISGCSNPAPVSDIQRSNDMAATKTIAELKSREATLIARCEKIASEKKVLAAKYNALIEVYDMNYKPEPSEPIVRDLCSIDVVQRSEEVSAKDVRGKKSGAASQIEEHDDEHEMDVAVTQSDIPPPNLCWESYCPCNPPQGGPDQLLCDQLRIGKVEPEMLSVGKSMREVRRQIAETDF